MFQFFRIGWEVIAPIFLMMGVGFAVQRRLGFDIKSLTRLNFWVFVPAFLFVQIFESKLSAADFFRVGLHFVILFSLMFALTWWLAGLLKVGDRLRRAMTASVLFYNSGNYGVPVSQLAFPGAGVSNSVQAVVVMLQSLTNFTLGLGLHAGGREETKPGDTLRAMLRLPMIYALAAAGLWRGTGWPLPAPLGSALHYLSGALVPVALVTLGAQMATLRSHRFRREMALALVLRLMVGPLLAFGLVRALGITGELAQALVVSASFPTAVNSALLAIEFDNEPDYAASVVFYSTLASALTVSLTILLARQMG